jgi:hypothetical protein
VNDKASKSGKKKGQLFVDSLLLGKAQPDVFTRLIFQVAIIGYVLLFLWSLVSWFAFSFGWKVEVDKGTQIIQLIESRASYYGLTRAEFQRQVTQFHILSMVSWLTALLSAILLYRKKPIFLSFMLIGHGLYFTSLMYLLGFDFFLRDIGWFEKLTVLVTHISGWICWVLQRNERQGKSILLDYESIEE